MDGVLFRTDAHMSLRSVLERLRRLEPDSAWPPISLSASHLVLPVGALMEWDHLRVPMFAPTELITKDLPLQTALSRLHQSEI